MRFSKLLCPTLKESPNDAEIASHKLMIRAGMIRKLSSGIYNLLPLGLKVMRKFEAIVREEMNDVDAQECLLPSLIPSDLWKESGRWDKYGKELLRITDRHNNNFCFGPTHEEVITDIAKKNIRSYKELPISLYQIQTKFRDEIRPRFGLMRGREFIMKDAYSFHADDASLSKTYLEMKAAYKSIFKRCGLDYKIVQADSGSIGGSNSEEFMLTAATGEDMIVDCPACEYAANLEAATCDNQLSREENFLDSAQALDVEEKRDTSFTIKDKNFSSPTDCVFTPNMETIEAVASHLKLPQNKCIKALLLFYGHIPVMVVIRGGDQLNECKLKIELDTLFEEPQELRFAEEADIKALNLLHGFMGPSGLNDEQFKHGLILSDLKLKGIKGACAGANKKDHHFINIDEGRDFKPDHFYDLRNVQEGDVCPTCKTGKLGFVRGIEVGHIFKLGHTYSKAMKAEFLDMNGKTQPFEMGCYGIGIGRTVAAAIEQHHDEKGIIWPKELAPFDVAIVLIGHKDSDLTSTADSIYQSLKKDSFDVLYDDRKESPGRKFNDLELIGIPFQVVVGRSFKETGKVEWKCRRTGSHGCVGIDELSQTLNSLLNNGS
jgi:prolyl-tRNA synthetase